MQYFTYFPALTSVINIVGYSLNFTQNVFLSSANITTLALTAYKNDILEHVYGIPYIHYKIVSENILAVNIYNLPLTGVYDIIVANPAGYTKMSDSNFLISYNGV